MGGCEQTVQTEGKMCKNAVVPKQKPLNVGESQKVTSEPDFFF